MVQIKYYSGYIRNYKKLCEELGITLPLSREDRESSPRVLKNGARRSSTTSTEPLPLR